MLLPQAPLPPPPPSSTSLLQEFREYGGSGANSNPHPHGYGVDGSIQPNGNGMSNAFNDLEDPAALLESLAHFDTHAPAGFENHISSSNNHFASLLQAVASAGSNEDAQINRPQDHVEEHDHINEGQVSEQLYQESLRRESVPTSPTQSHIDATQIQGPIAEGLRGHMIEGQSQPYTNERRSQDYISERQSQTPAPTSEQLDRSPSPLTIDRSKRKRQASDDLEDDEQSTIGFVLSRKTNKRRKTALEIQEEAAERAREREIWGPEDLLDEDGSTIDYQSNPVTAGEARAVGVHSAAALFRRPSAASKKYTRPPMHKLFTSLELTPEQFLHLQAGAKSYMLDKDHPERSDCVGNKGRADTTMTKLKLFGCVEAFLQDEGWGDRCFGVNAPGAENRKLKWPQMKNKLISLVTPLLRRMVTNERQRQYAMESRKDKEKRAPKGIEAELAAILEKGKRNREASDSPRKVQKTSSLTTPHAEVIDPNLEQIGSKDSIDALKSKTPTPSSISSPETKVEGGLTYYVNILQDGRRIKPRITLNDSTCPAFPNLMQHIHGAMGDGLEIVSIKMLGATGLIGVGTPEAWANVVTGIKENEWMDGELKILVEVEKKP